MDSELLLTWYYTHRRILPFREDPTPYHVWVSEIMLQQTRVSAVLPYYQRFMAALPDIPALATCGEERLLKLWEGLGYYSRARNLQSAAKLVVAQYGGQLPADFARLQALPGIGPYTAGAIASIAFGLPEVAVDGNVLRVFARLFACGDDISLPATRAKLEKQVRAHQPSACPGDYNQAIMELGALVCVPGAPRCDECPLPSVCKGCQKELAAALPVKAAKPAKTQIEVTGFVVWRGGEVLLQKRPAKGLLAGMWQPLLVEKALTLPEATRFLANLLPGATVGETLPAARHVFTHRVWNLQGYLCRAPQNAPAPEGCRFIPTAEVAKAYALPGAFKAWLPFFAGGARA